MSRSSWIDRLPAMVELPTVLLVNATVVGQGR
jgi:hypothetical protein